MIRCRFRLALAIVATIVLVPSVAGQGPAREALFGLESPVAGPFPSDWFTVPDHTNKTHRRVSLPLPDCEVYVSDCEDVAVINELDGFNLQPRLSVPFSGPIDANTVTSDTVFLVSLGSAAPDQHYMPWGTVIGIDQVVWDTFTNTLHVESNALLAQHTRFALIVTRGVRDQFGVPVAASDAFRRFRANVREEYKQVLLDAIQAARDVGVREEDIAVASVFTTQSATAVLEKIRDQIHAATPDPADFLLGSNGERTVFNPNEITSVLWNQQTRDAPPGFTLRALDLSAISTFPGAIGRVGFGKYLSPDYAVHPGEYIPPIGTRTGTPTVQEVNEIYFNLYLPSGPMPPNGWPVALVGHGINGSKNLAGSFVGAPPGDRGRDQQVSALAAHGFASITTNSVGVGFGRLGTLTVNTTAGASLTFSAGGRGLDQIPRDGVIGNNEGGVPAPPRRIVHYSDAFRQTAVDLMQLVRVIKAGMDLDGDGLRDLDPSRIYFQGGSWSGGYGTVFMGVEPDVRTAVLKAPGDPLAIGPLGPANRRAVGAILDSRHPSLLNPPGVSVFAGLPAAAPRFDENQPLRNQVLLGIQLEGGTARDIVSPVTNSVTGAMAIQEVFERFEWVSQAGSPVAYAAHLRKAPLRDMPVKNVVYVILKGDQTAPNPTATAIVRAGEMADRTMYYRHDLAVLDFPTLPRNPHGFNVATIAPEYLQLDATFFVTDGLVVIHPAPARYFEFPLVGPLPEDLNFIR